MSLKARISDDMKSAMRARDAERLKAIRLLLAAIKQREVDERIELADADVVGVIDRMLKQRRESIAQFEKAGRQDLATAESLIVFDDTPWSGSGWVGKGAQAIPWLLTQGWEVLYGGYQVILQHTKR